MLTSPKLTPTIYDYLTSKSYNFHVNETMETEKLYMCLKGQVSQWKFGKIWYTFGRSLYVLAANPPHAIALWTGARQNLQNHMCAPQRPSRAVRSESSLGALWKADDPLRQSAWQRRLWSGCACWSESRGFVDFIVFRLIILPLMIFFHHFRPCIRLMSLPTLSTVKILLSAWWSSALWTWMTRRLVCTLSSCVGVILVRMYRPIC